MSLTTDYLLEIADEVMEEKCDYCHEPIGFQPEIYVNDMHVHQTCYRFVEDMYNDLMPEDAFGDMHDDIIEF